MTCRGAQQWSGLENPLHKGRNRVVASGHAHATQRHCYTHDQHAPAPLLACVQHLLQRYSLHVAEAEWWVPLLCSCCG
jgi:hypothetical protein